MLKQQSRTAGALRELHLHPHPLDNQWWWEVFIEGGTREKIPLKSSREAVEQEAAERFGPELQIFVWAQDGGMIVSAL